MGGTYSATRAAPPAEGPRSTFAGVGGGTLGGGCRGLFSGESDGVRIFVAAVELAASGRPGRKQSSSPRMCIDHARRAAHDCVSDDVTLRRNESSSGVMLQVLPAGDAEQLCCFFLKEPPSRMNSSDWSAQRNACHSK